MLSRVQLSAVSSNTEKRLNCSTRLSIGHGVIPRNSHRCARSKRGPVTNVLPLNGSRCRPHIQLTTVLKKMAGLPVSACSPLRRLMSQKLMKVMLCVPQRESNLASCALNFPIHHHNFSTKGIQFVVKHGGVTSKTPNGDRRSRLCRHTHNCQYSPVLRCRQ